MAEYLIQDTTLTGIADAIRAKTGSTATMKPTEFATAISSIEAGASASPERCIFLFHQTIAFYKYSRGSTYSANLNTILPAGSVLLNTLYASATTGTSTATNLNGYAAWADGYSNTSVITSETDSGVKVSLSTTFTATYQYSGGAKSFCFTFYTPGFYIKRTDGQEAEMYTDETVTTYPEKAYAIEPLKTVDLSKSTISTLPQYSFYNMPSLKSIKLPATIASIGIYGIYNLTNLEELDMSECANVPSLSGSTSQAIGGLPASAQIKVPAALYDEWIAATNWSSLASQIVAV